MNLQITIIVSLLAISASSLSQPDTALNSIDQQGRKQGHWIKRYPDESILYDGYFKDDHPVGEFKRYDEVKTLRSILIYSTDGSEAVATIYHPNGYIASKGKYINQKKEGKWQFFSANINGYLISEDNYVKNIRNGTSVKFYPDSTIAELVNFVNDKKQGEWTQFYPNGSVCLKSNFTNGKINGKFEVWFEDGNIQFSGQYKNDTRDGQWFIYNKDGSIKYKIQYNMGLTNDQQMDIDESDYIDLIEKNSNKITDPEKSGIIR